MIIAEPVTERNIRETLDQITKLVKKAGETPEEHPLKLYRNLWANHKLFFTVLKNRETGETLGYTVCFSLKDSFLNKLNKLKKEKKPIKSHVRSGDVLDFAQAERLVPSSGNVVYISLNSWRDNKPNFHIGLPLFFSLELAFYKLRARVVLCETRQEMTKLLCKASGCDTLYYSKHNDEVFYFDAGLLKHPAKMTSGLGVVLAHNWGPPEGFPLGLSERKKMIACGLVEGVLEKNLSGYLAERFGVQMQSSTVREHIKEIYAKAERQLGLQSRTAIVGYLTLHRFELFSPLDTKKYKVISE